ncbi:hypothetical protein [Flavobacterium cyclinae]|uniref:hypothetical protein n=1 Tax=Flavobacterium cyclinae TaxID=2895947 RepID=UPI001E533DA8|nr:hypothetical protein [Flavobacterium cyclinae]UGS19921.1 hypothetical protein LOS86_07775 [Flavobacterium cyclinae]
MASGKQILLHFLNKFSLKKTNKEALAEASETIRVGFLLHGSTPKEAWQMVDTIEWGEEIEEESQEVISQGLRIKDKNISLTELFDYMTWDSDAVRPQKVGERFPELKQSEYYAATRVMALVLSSIEWSSWLSEIEQDGKIDPSELEAFLTSYKEKLKNYRNDPENYV